MQHGKSGSTVWLNRLNGKLRWQAPAVDSFKRVSKEERRWVELMERRYSGNQRFDDGCVPIAKSGQEKWHEKTKCKLLRRIVVSTTPQDNSRRGSDAFHPRVMLDLSDDSCQSVAALARGGGHGQKASHNKSYRVLCVAQNGESR